jgi:type II secretory pathway pseudopilin PulG
MLVAKRDIESKGQSIVEVVIAVAIFIIIAASSVVTVIGSLSTSRLAEEETQATTLALEGIEAAQSMRNQDWANLDTGGVTCTDSIDRGADASGGFWVWSASPQVIGKYARTVTISNVCRDAQGDISESGITYDEEVKRVTSSVDWDFTAGRTNLVNIETYLTQWQKSKGTVAAGGTPTPTPTASPTPAPTFTPTPTPSYASCDEVCVGGGYSAGTCRKNARACNQNGETRDAAGDQFCTGGSNADTCCCAP